MNESQTAVFIPYETGIRKAIVWEALSWLGTPYHDHAGVKGVGVDCGFYPFRVYQAMGIIPMDAEPPPYSPHQWLVRKGGKVLEDTTFLDMVLKYSKREITEAEVQPGDLVLFLLAKSWTHGAIVVEYPGYLLHPVQGRDVIGSGTNEGFFLRRPRRYFTFI